MVKNSFYVIIAVLILSIPYFFYNSSSTLNNNDKVLNSIQNVSLKKDLYFWRNAFIKQDKNEIVEMTYPQFFNIIPKHIMLANNPAEASMESRVSNFRILKVGEIREFEYGKFLYVDYSYDIKMKMPNDKKNDFEIFANIMENQNKNVQINRDKKELFMSKITNLVVINDNLTNGKWKIFEIKKGLINVLPTEILNDIKNKTN